MLQHAGCYAVAAWYYRRGFRRDKSLNKKGGSITATVGEKAFCSATPHLFRNRTRKRREVFPGFMRRLRYTGPISLALTLCEFTRFSTSCEEYVSLSYLTSKRW